MARLASFAFIAVCIVWHSATMACGLEAAADSPAFDIWEYEVAGNTRLDQIEIEKRVYPFLGPRRTVEDIDKACLALQEAYRDAGFQTVSVDIPVQSTATGVIALNVVEGRVDRVRVTGARHYEQGRILEALPALTEGEVLDFKALQTQMADLNHGSDLRVQPLLRPGRNPGSTEVELKVDDNRPLHGNFEINNRYGPSRAPDPGDYRVSGTLRYDNLWQRDHSVSLSYLTSPGHSSEAQVTSAAYTLPVGAPDRLLTLYGVHSNSTADLTTTLAGTAVLGKGDIIGLRYNRPVSGIKDWNQSLTFGLDYKHFLEDLNQDGGEGFSTPLTYWLPSVQYATSSFDDQGQTDFGAGLSFSIRGLRNNEEQFGQKRFKGQGNFVVFKWNARRLQTLPRSFQLDVSADGQLASRALPSSEQYAGGGVDSVRGYPEATQVGDYGLRGMIELRTPSLIAGQDEPWADLRLLSFIEGASLRILDPLPGQTDRFNLASTGVGLRFNARRGFVIAADYAWRLKDGLTTDTHGSVEKGGGRLHFSAAFQF